MAKGISLRKRYQVLERDNFRCRYCGAPSTDAYLVMDHVIPKHHGGRDAANNLVAACEACNGGKLEDLPTAAFVEMVRLAQAEYEIEHAERKTCARCSHIAYCHIEVTGEDVCGICYAAFMDGARWAGGEPS